MQSKPQAKDGWFLGIDLGTGSCKSVVIDSQAHILSLGTGSYPASNVYQTWQEQDPESLLAGMIHSVRAAVEMAGVEPTACLGLSLGSAMHSLIAVDQAGVPLTGVITWADGRGAPQAQAVRQSVQAAQLYQDSGCPPHGMYPLYKILWLKQERPILFARAARFITVKEYMTQKLTGQPWVDFSIASGSGLLNVHDLRWNTLAMDLAGIKADHLGQPGSPYTTCPSIEHELAQAMGLSPQTPFVLGSSDAANSNLGAGAVHAWQATCMIGTSGAFRIIAPRPILDEKARMWCYGIDEEHWLVGGAINNGGIALSWLKDALNQAITSLPNQPALSFEDLIQLASQVNAGAGGLVCLPFFAGERSPNWNLNARAAFIGMTLDHDMRHLARALLESIAFRLRSLNEILGEMVGEIREIRASGGFTHSSLWPQVIASTLDRNLLVPGWGETSSLGAAFWAMLGVGAIKTFDEVEKLVPIATQYAPISGDTLVYEKLYRLYTRLYIDLAQSFDQFAEIQSEFGPKK